MDCVDANGLGLTVSGTLDFELCSSDRDREAAFRGGSYRVDHSLAAHQPTYLVYYWGLKEGSRSADRPVSVLGVKQSLAK